MPEYSEYNTLQFCPSARQIRTIQRDYDFVIALYPLLTKKCGSIGEKIGVRLLCVSLIPLDVDGITIVSRGAVKYKGQTDRGILLIKVYGNDRFILEDAVISAHFSRPEGNRLIFHKFVLTV